MRPINIKVAITAMIFYFSTVLPNYGQRIVYRNGFASALLTVNLYRFPEVSFIAIAFTYLKSDYNAMFPPLGFFMTDFIS